VTADCEELGTDAYIATERQIGQAKECRGFRRFLLRGLRAVQAEWSLVCTGHNLLKLYRFSPVHV